MIGPYCCTVLSMTLEVNWVVGSMLSVFVIFPAVMAAAVILSLNSFRQAGIVGLVGLAIN